VLLPEKNPSAGNPLKEPSNVIVVVECERRYGVGLALGGELASVAGSVGAAPGHCP